MSALLMLIDLAVIGTVTALLSIVVIRLMMSPAGTTGANREQGRDCGKRQPFTWTHEDKIFAASHEIDLSHIAEHVKRGDAR